MSINSEWLLMPPPRRAMPPPPSPIQHRLYATLQSIRRHYHLPPPLKHRYAAQPPPIRAYASCQFKWGKKGGKCVLHVVMGVGCTTYMYVRIHKHAVRYVAVACGVLSRRLIHYLPDGTTFLIDSSSFDNFFSPEKYALSSLYYFF